MILLPHFDIPYGFGLGKIPYDLPFQGPVFFALDFLISVDPQISIDLGKIGKNNKRRPSNKHRPWKNLTDIIIKAH